MIKSPKVTPFGWKHLIGMSLTFESFLRQRGTFYTGVKAEQGKTPSHVEGILTREGFYSDLRGTTDETVPNLPAC